MSSLFYVCLFCLTNSAVKVNTKFAGLFVAQPGSLSLPRSRRKSVLEVNKRSSESMHFNFLADVLNFESLILHHNRWEEGGDGEGGRIIHGPTEWYSKY